MAGFTEHLTTEGEMMLAKMLKGTKIVFTRIVFGDGELSPSQSIKKITELNNQKMQIDVESVVISGGTNIVIGANLSNDQITEGFYLREKGIYMSDGETEVLGIYANNGSNAEFIEEMTSKYVMKKLKTIIAMTDSANINIEIRTGKYANAPITLSKQTFEDFLKSETAKTLAAGDVVLAQDAVYTFLGGDYTDADRYSLQKRYELISTEKELVDNEESGKLADATLVKRLYQNIAKLVVESEFQSKKTIFVDDYNIRTEYKDGTAEAVTISEDGNTIVTTFFDKAGDAKYKRTTIIKDDTIEESVTILKADDFAEYIYAIRDSLISFDLIGDTLEITSSVDATLVDDTLMINL